MPRGLSYTSVSWTKQAGIRQSIGLADFSDDWLKPWDVGSERYVTLACEDACLWSVITWLDQKYDGIVIPAETIIYGKWYAYSFNAKLQGGSRIHFAFNHGGVMLIRHKLVQTNIDIADPKFFEVLAVACDDAIARGCVL